MAAFTRQSWDRAERKLRPTRSTAPEAASLGVVHRLGAGIEDPGIVGLERPFLGEEAAQGPGG